MDLREADLNRWFAEEIQPHEAMLRAWLERRFVSACDVDDILQEAYVRVLEAGQRGELKSPKAFLFATARNLAIDGIRRRRIVREEPLVETETSSVLEEGDSIPERVARNQELSILADAVQALPTRCRQVFTLRKVYNLSQTEIATRMGITEHTVSAQLTIAVHKCTEYLDRRRAREAAQ